MPTYYLHLRYDGHSDSLSDLLSMNPDLADGVRDCLSTAANTAVEQQATELGFLDLEKVPDAEAGIYYEQPGRAMVNLFLQYDSVNDVVAREQATALTEQAPGHFTFNMNTCDL